MSSKSVRHSANIRQIPLYNGILLVLLFLLILLNHNISFACEPSNIRLNSPIQLSPEESDFIHSLPKLKISGIHAPPLVYDEENSGTYGGIAADILCFIADEINLDYEIKPVGSSSLAEMIQAVQDKKIDLFMPLSKEPERAKLGLFTSPYYSSYYVIIAKKGHKLNIHSFEDIKNYKVGYIGGAALDSVLNDLVSEQNLIPFNGRKNITNFYKALDSGKVDVLIHNQLFFDQDRYEHELFNLETIFIIRQYPRSYRYYLSDTENNRKLLPILNKYLIQIDNSKSLLSNEIGEKELIAKYVNQLNKKFVYQASTIVMGLLAILLAFLLYRHHVFSGKLTNSYNKIREQQKLLEQANQELNTISITDPLTQIANRRYFNHKIEQLFNNLPASVPISLLILDLDHFKMVNDEYGHLVGDEYLQKIAAIISNALKRENDLAARYGGEEFACLLPNTKSAAAHEIAEEIRNQVIEANLPNIKTELKYLTISIGIATLNSGSCTITELIDSADAQLYMAKNSGRNRVCATGIN